MKTKFAFLYAAALSCSPASEFRQKIPVVDIPRPDYGIPLSEEVPYRTENHTPRERVTPSSTITRKIKKCANNSCADLIENLQIYPLYEGDKFGEDFLPFDDFKGITIHKIRPEGVDLEVRLSTSEIISVKLEYGNEWSFGEFFVISKIAAAKGDDPAQAIITITRHY